MSTLREQIKQRSADLVKRESVELPECGLTVQARGLMSGEAQRAGEHKRSADVQVALGTEDPATGKLVWNANSREDLDEIAALHSVDKAVLLTTINRLSGVDQLKKLFSPESANGISSSLSSSDEAFTS